MPSADMLAPMEQVRPRKSVSCGWGVRRGR